MSRLMRSVKHVSAIGVLLAGAFPILAINAAAPQSAGPEEIQGDRDPDSRLTVPVTINGGGPYDFVVDTGAERTVISRELARQLTLAPSEPVILLSISGTDQVDTAIVPLLQLSQSRSRLADLQAPLLSEYHLGARGMLGIDSLQTKRVVMDFHKMSMSISDAPRAAILDTDEIVVTARRKLGQLILVDADADGQKIAVIIDTGSAVSIGNEMLRKRLTARGRLGRAVPISITSVTGSQTPASYTQVDRVRIGGVTMTNMPVAFADARIFQRLGLNRKPALLLGMDALRLFDRVSIDFANRNVRFILKGNALQYQGPRLAGGPLRGRG